MITKNISGNDISQSFIDEIRSDSPNTTVRLMLNGSQIPCDIVKTRVSKGSCGSATFCIGEVVGDMLTATVKNLSADLKDKTIEYQVGALVNGSYEYISLGNFVVSDVKKTRYQQEITAYTGIVGNSGIKLNFVPYPTISGLAMVVAEQLGCLVRFDNDIVTNLDIVAPLDNLTVYEALQVLAMCCGGYAVNTTDGNVWIRHLNAIPNLSVDTGMMTKLPEISERYTLESVSVEVADAAYDERGNSVSAVYVSRMIKKIQTHTGLDIKTHTNKYLVASGSTTDADLQMSNKYVTEEIFKANIEPVIGYEYYPASVHLTLGDPRLEGSDVLAVTDVDGTVYNVPCHQITHSYTSALVTDIRSATANNAANRIGTAMPITKRLERIERQSDAANQTANSAVHIAGNTDQHFWFVETGEDTGAHITEIPQEEFLENPQNGGANLLARSNGVACRDGLTELAVFAISQLRVGRADKNRFHVNNTSLQAYDTNNELYFQVNSDGMSYGDKTVANTDELAVAVSSASAKTQYYLSTSSSVVIGGEWQDTVPTWATGKFIWTRVATTKTTIGGTSSTTYSTAVYDSALTTALSTSESAQASADGAASTVTTTQQFYLSTSDSTATGGSWSDSEPTWSTGKYVWTRYKIVKTTVGGTATTSYTTEVYDKTVTDALISAEDASKVATNYLTNISGTDGISVHDIDDLDNFANINADGMDIYQDGTDVAHFGAETRIGDINSANVIITNTETLFHGNNGELVGAIESGMEISGDFTETIKNKNGYVYSANVPPILLYARPLDYPPLGNITINFTISGAAYIRTISSTQDSDTTSDGIRIRYTAVSRLLEVWYVSGHMTDSNKIEAYEIDYDFDTETETVVIGNLYSIAGVLGPALTINSAKSQAVFAVDLAPGTQIFCACDLWYQDESVYYENIIEDHTYGYFTAGTSATKTFNSSSPYYRTRTVTVYYDGDKTIRITGTTADHGCRFSNLTYYAKAAWIRSSAKVTYNRHFLAPQYIFGIFNNAGDYALASLFGEGLEAGTSNQTVVGKYNSAGNKAFYVGSGNGASSRANAMEVDWNGNTTIAGRLTQSSDRRLKEHLDYLDDDAVEFIRDLKPAHFLKDNEDHVGFYAQDVEESDKWHCMTGEMNGFKTLGYTEILAPLVRYCQKLEERIAELERRE